MQDSVQQNFIIVRRTSIMSNKIKILCRTVSNKLFSNIIIIIITLCCKPLTRKLPITCKGTGPPLH